MKSKLKTFFENSTLSEQSISIISELWNKSSTIKKNEYLLKKSQKENYLYFINSGCIASIVEGENKESVLGFGYSGSIITSFISFSTETPTDLSLLAISDTEIIKISKRELYQLMNNHTDIAKWYTTLLEKTLVVSSKKAN